MNRFRLWLRSALLRRRLEREMQEEMTAHLDRSAARLMERGLSADAARSAAVREFGNVAHLQEQARDARGAQWLDALLADVRFALRHFARKPGVTAVMFVVLAAGMSISTLLFSYVHSYASAPPSGVPLAHDLVRVRGSRTAGADGRAFRTFSEAEFREYEQLTPLFKAVTGSTTARVTLTADGQPHEVGASFVTPNYFRVIGVAPVLGAGLPATDADGTPVVVIGHEIWTNLFAQDPGVIGSALTLNGVSFTIVGVAPPRFSGVPMGSSLWLPLSARAFVLPGVTHEFHAFGRLQPGASEAEATAAVRVIAGRVAAANRELDALEPSTDVVPLLSANGDPMFERDVRLMTMGVGLLALLVLAITCTNVSALLTGLATGRRHEIAIRLSLGAARKRLIRQLLTESVVLSAVAATAAIHVVWAGLRTVAALFPMMPFEIRITWPATLFTFGVALAVGILFGLSPALHATRLALAGALRNSSPTITAVRGRLQRALVVAQIAFTQPLIVTLAAVLMLLFTTMQPKSRTESSDRVVTLSLRSAAGSSGSLAGGAAARNEHNAAVTRVRARLAAVPGVSQAIVTWKFTDELGRYVMHENERAAGARAAGVELTGEWVAPGYFDVLGIPIVRGRDFAAHEYSTVEPRNDVSVIISNDLARTVWQGADPVGKRLQPSVDSLAHTHSFVVVGVIDDPLAKGRKPGQDYRIYLPPDTMWSSSIVLRTREPAQPLLAAMRKATQEAAPGMVMTLRTLADIESGQKRMYRTVTAALYAAGMAALLLSAIGLYAVVAFSVAQRTREIAVRVAVGGRASQIVRRFIADGVQLSVIGLLLGMPISLLGLHSLISMVDDLPQIPLAPVAALAAAGVFIVSMTAAWLPARHAAAVDPAITLRAES